MKNKTFTKILLVVVGLGLLCSIAPAEAFARGNPRGGNRFQARHEESRGRGARYQYNDNRSYRPSRLGFVVVRPPVGEFVRVLPPGHRAFMHRGARYYCHNNVYYRECDRGGYIVISEPVWWFNIIFR